MSLREEESTRLQSALTKTCRIESDSDEGEEELDACLFICKKIVDMNDGEIKVFSDSIHGGTTYQFSMKMYKPE